jgi:hypothetical protein
MSKRQLKRANIEIQIISFPEKLTKRNVTNKNRSACVPEIRREISSGCKPVPICTDNMHGTESEKFVPRHA